MRVFIVALALFAWISTCLDTVSYLRARNNERTAQAEARRADDTIAAPIAQNLTESEPLHSRLQKDQQTSDAAPDRNLALQDGDVIHASTDPTFAAAHDDLQVYENAAAHAETLQARDIRLGEAIAALWFAVFVLTLWSRFGHRDMRTLNPEHRSA